MKGMFIKDGLNKPSDTRLIPVEDEALVIRIGQDIKLGRLIKRRYIINELLAWRPSISCAFAVRF